jgi:hypothetical protein
MKYFNQKKSYTNPKLENFYKTDNDFKTKFQDLRIFLQNTDPISRRHNFICVNS